MTKTWVVHVVDDDEPVRMSMSFALQAVGLRTATYADAGEFLERGRGERGVLMSDVRMPGMTGIELTRLLRQDGSDMPIILMSGQASELQIDAIGAGADLVLDKPVAWAPLLAEITRMTFRWA